MAIQRTAPFIWVSWLSKIMVGENPCIWQAWFLAHNKLTSEQPSDFNLVGWKIDHSRMLSELSNELKTTPITKVYSEHELKYTFGSSGSVLMGKADCILVQPNSATIYDCKTGKERDSDQVQVMIYMWLLSRDQDFANKPIHGEVIYKNRKAEIGKLPDTFEDNLKYYIDILASKSAPIKNPGSPCRFCPITKEDCKDRSE